MEVDLLWPILLVCVYWVRRFLQQPGPRLRKPSLQLWVMGVVMRVWGGWEQRNGWGGWEQRNEWGLSRGERYVEAEGDMGTKA
jgi:hypothetical protein